MKSTKTVLAVALVIAGFAYAGDLDPPKGKITPTIQTWEYKFVHSVITVDSNDTVDECDETNNQLCVTIIG